MLAWISLTPIWVSMSDRVLYLLRTVDVTYINRRYGCRISDPNITVVVQTKIYYLARSKSVWLIRGVLHRLHLYYDGVLLRCSCTNFLFHSQALTYVGKYFRNWVLAHPSLFMPFFTTGLGTQMESWVSSGLLSCCVAHLVDHLRRLDNV